MTEEVEIATADIGVAGFTAVVLTTAVGVDGAMAEVMTGLDEDSATEDDGAGELSLAAEEGAEGELSPALEVAGESVTDADVVDAVGIMTADDDEGVGDPEKLAGSASDAPALIPLAAAGPSLMDCGAGAEVNAGVDADATVAEIRTTGVDAGEVGNSNAGVAVVGVADAGIGAESFAISLTPITPVAAIATAARGPDEAAAAVDATEPPTANAATDVGIPCTD
ncbi:hypothetical protein HK101_002515 [Irineochytrium annulatum]|nr:hypothetical protein HK101_002515 [Irineochytrium annulatum]